MFKQEDKQRIHFELTESCLIDPLHHHHLKMLQQEGHKVFIDDFGTGYSSMEYLIELSINGIKLDRFFSNYAGRIQYKKFITKTVEMAKSLNLSVVTEGIENSFQKSFFTQLGCDGIQGYFESKPMAPEAIPLYLNSKLVKGSTR